MKATTALSLAFASVGLVTGQSHGHRGAHVAAHHKKRGGLVTEWVTEWVTTTVIKWVDDLPTEAAGVKPATAPPVVPIVPTEAPAQFFEPATTAAPPPPPPPSSTPVAVALPVSPPEGGAGPNRVDSAQQNSGELTFYDLGLGACGENDGGKDESENIVALSHLFMGTQSNGNPYCGKTITIEYNGKRTTAVVRDKCMGCAYGDIDVSRHCFKEFASEGAGRIHVNWWVN